MNMEWSSKLQENRKSHAQFTIQDFALVLSVAKKYVCKEVAGIFLGARIFALTIADIPASKSKVISISMMRTIINEITMNI